MCCILSATRFNEAFLSAADSARQAVQGRAGGGHAQASVHLECDAPAQSAVEAELVSEHPLTFNTVTQHDSEGGCLAAS